MPNIASVLKEEVTRLARKELRAETEGLKKASAQYRSDIAALKRRITDLEKQLARLEKLNGAVTAAKVAAAPAGPVRFSPKGLSAQRTRLGISAAEMGALLGVSGQTIYNWEAGTTRPRDGQIAAIAALRKMGKREAGAKLSASQAPAPSPAP